MSQSQEGRLYERKIRDRLEFILANHGYELKDGFVVLTRSYDNAQRIQKLQFLLKMVMEEGYGT